jgi:molecular chaperone HtpG
MKDMSAMGGGGFNMYGQMPDSYSLVVNSNHPIIGSINSAKTIEIDTELQPLNDEIKLLNGQKEKLESETKSKKDEEITHSQKEEIAEITKNIDAADKNKNEILTNFGKNYNPVKQLIDLALLSNNKLKGEALAAFVKRSVELMKS